MTGISAWGWGKARKDSEEETFNLHLNNEKKHVFQRLDKEYSSQREMHEGSHELGTFKG